MYKLHVITRKLFSQWYNPYMVLGLCEGEFVLISDIKFDKEFKVKSHRLKLYLTLDPPAPADMVNLHLPEDVASVSPSPH